MAFFRFLYTIYTLFLFTLSFLLCFPIFVFFIAIGKPRHWLALKVNQLWGYMFFIPLFMPFKVIYEKKLEKDKTYVFVANHFSFFDIPLFGLNRIPAAYLGKSEIEKWPLFGFMFKNMHIAVNRNDVKDRYAALFKSRKALSEGTSVIIFPEGGIVTKDPPNMVRFKDGAFRAAIEEQISIVPVTIPYNWIILPDNKMPLMKWHKIEIIFHEPISMKGKTLKDVDMVKKQVFDLIDRTLKEKNCIQYEDNKRNAS